MKGNEERRGGLRRWLVDRWTPLFAAETTIASLTAEEFATACDWERLRSSGVVANHEEPLGLAGLRLSSIFPRHLLRRRDDGRLVPIAFDDARALVRLTLALEGRDTGATSDDILEGVDGASDESDDMDALDRADTIDVRVDENAADAAVNDAPDAAETGGSTRTRRRFFRRRS
jgi:hypothetical protein